MTAVSSPPHNLNRSPPLLRPLSFCHTIVIGNRLSVVFCFVLNALFISKGISVFSVVIALFLCCLYMSKRAGEGIGYDYLVMKVGMLSLLCDIGW